MDYDDFSLDELRGHDMDYREERHEARRQRMRRWKEGDNPFFSSYDDEEGSDE